MKHQRPAQPSTAINVDQLLELGVQYARSGKTPAARAVFRALTHEVPGDVRPWVGIARVAETLDERRRALEQAVALVPNNANLRAQLARLSSEVAAPTVPTVVPAAPSVAGTTLEPQAERDDESTAALDQQRRRATWLYLAVLLVVGIILLWLIISSLPAASSGSASFVAAATPSLVAPVAEQQSAVGASQATTTQTQTDPSPPAATVTTVATAESERDTTTPVPATVPPRDTSTPTEPAQVQPTALPFGVVGAYDGWNATVLRPDYALVLDSNVMDVQPQGAFVLVLVAVDNTADASRPLPPDLFTLVDARGTVYRPVAEASRAYIDKYGRGQHGDLALDDAFAPRSGMLSVPLIFDVPPRTAALELRFGDAQGGGWPVLDQR